MNAVQGQFFQQNKYFNQSFDVWQAARDEQLESCHRELVYNLATSLTANHFYRFLQPYSVDFRILSVTSSTAKSLFCYIYTVLNKLN